MKKLVTAIVLGLLINVANAKTTNNVEINDNNKTTLVKDSFMKIYQWSVKGQGFEASGTATSLENAKAAIAYVSKGEVVLEEIITSAYVSLNELKENKTSKVYYWSVKGERFQANGRALTLKDAEKIIEQIAGNSIKHEVIIGHK